MAITFSVAKNSFPDNLSDADLATAIKAWLDALEAETVYSIETQHFYGLWHVVCIYE
jgi:hypothetical protein